MILFTRRVSNGFTVNAIPTNKSGYYTNSIIAKNGSRIIAECKNQNSLFVPQGLFEDGDICTVFVTFSETEIHFSKYITLHNKTKLTEDASKAARKQARCLYGAASEACIRSLQKSLKKPMLKQKNKNRGDV